MHIEREVRKMKAAVLTRYGSPQKLELQEIEEPVPKENEVKVKVHASSVNDWDWCITHGSPFYIRLFCGLIKPKIRALGVDIAGTVVAVGDQVTKFKVGDEVLGDLSECGFGGYAESCCVSEQILTLKPKAISHLQAAALPHAAALALQGLQAGGTLGADTRLLINGAGGGVGTLGLQIARAMGVGFVAGVDHTSKLDMLRDLGFDKVIDYTSSDFTEEGQTYDLILDTKTNRSPFHYLKALSSTGKYVTVGGMTKRIIQLLVLVFMLPGGNALVALVLV